MCMDVYIYTYAMCVKEWEEGSQTLYFPQHTYSYVFSYIYWVTTLSSISCYLVLLELSVSFTVPTPSSLLSLSPFLPLHSRAFFLVLLSYTHSLKGRGIKRVREGKGREGEHTMEGGTQRENEWHDNAVSSVIQPVRAPLHIFSQSSIVSLSLYIPSHSCSLYQDFVQATVSAV